VILGRKVALALAGLVVGAPAVASGSTIVYSCPNGTLSGVAICAVDPEKGSDRQLIANNPGEKSRASRPSITRDGSTFGAVVFGQTAVARQLRLVGGAPGLPAPVASTLDTASLRDLAPPIASGGDSYDNLALGADAGSYVYTKTLYSPGAGGMINRQFPIFWHHDGTDELIVNSGRFLPLLDLLAGRPIYQATAGPATSVCLFAADNPCRPVATDTVPIAFPSGSPDGRSVLATVPRNAPGEKPFDPGGGAFVGLDSSLRLYDASTGKAIRTVAEHAKDGAFSPDGRYVVFEAAEKPPARLMIAPLDGSTAPRAIAKGTEPSWGGAMPPAGLARFGASVSAPRSLGSSALARGVGVKVSSLTKGTRVTIKITVRGKTVASVRSTARGSTLSRRIRLGAGARKKAAAANRITVSVVAGPSTTTKLIRIR
jgi:hypothetical protein